MSEWISVKDRLPEDETDVLVWCDGEGWDKAFYQDGDWRDALEGFRIYNVSHWMIPPEPPTSELSGEITSLTEHTVLGLLTED